MKFTSSGFSRLSSQRRIFPSTTFFISTQTQARPINHQPPRHTTKQRLGAPLAAAFQSTPPERLAIRLANWRGPPKAPPNPATFRRQERTHGQREQSYSTAQHSTAQHSTVRYGSVRTDRCTRRPDQKPEEDSHGAAANSSASPFPQRHPYIAGR